MTRTHTGLFRLLLLSAAVLAASAAYLLTDSKLYDLRLFAFALKLRLPALAVMLIASCSIGAASLIFQTIINNRIVTPCLLGMNSMYSLVHTAAVFFFGSGSILAVNANLAFAVDLAVMALTAVFIYGFLFKKTGHSVLYVLLIGTVLSSLFGSMQSALVRIMDPNEYDTLLVSLVADFNHVNSEIILISLLLLAVTAFALRRDLAVLDVLALGRDQAVSLGIDYDRTVRRLLLGVVLCISIATAMVGPVSFLGLIIANLARQAMKTGRHALLIPCSALMGMLAVIGGQLMTEHLFSFSVPVSTLITMGGGIYFLYLLLFKKEGGY